MVARHPLGYCMPCWQLRAFSVTWRPPAAQFPPHCSPPTWPIDTLLVAQFWAYDALLATWDDLEELTQCQLFSFLLTTRHHSSYSALFSLFNAVLVTRRHSNSSASCWKLGAFPVDRRSSALASLLDALLASGVSRGNQGHGPLSALPTNCRPAGTQEVSAI